MAETIIRGLLQFGEAHLEELRLTPNEKKDPTASMRLRAILTPELADQMGIRQSIFRPDDKPYTRLTKHSFDGTLRGVELRLPSIDEDGQRAGENVFYPEDIASFVINIDGMVATVTMLARIKDRYLELVDFLEKINTDVFEFAIRSRQGELNWDGVAGGTDVPLSGKNGAAEARGPLFQGNPGTLTDEDNNVLLRVNQGCVLCDRNVPRNIDGKHMVDGELVACDAVEGISEPDAANTREPAIVDAREMNDRRAKRQKTRAELGGKSDAEIQRGMKPYEPEHEPDVEVVQ